MYTISLIFLETALWTANSELMATTLADDDCKQDVTSSIYLFENDTHLFFFLKLKSKDNIYREIKISSIGMLKAHYLFSF